MDDLGKTLESQDYSENIYVSINGVGTKILRNCAYHDADNYIFIWSEQEEYFLNKKEVGDFVIVPYNHISHTSSD